MDPSFIWHPLALLISCPTKTPPLQPAPAFALLLGVCQNQNIGLLHHTSDKIALIDANNTWILDPPSPLQEYFGYVQNQDN